jgi:hypothetical protein
MSLWRRVFHERRRVVLPLLVLLLVDVGVLALGVFPLERHTLSLETAATDAEMARKLAQLDATKAATERTSRDTAEKDIRRFYTELLPRDITAANRLTNFMLKVAADESQIAYASGQWRPEKPDEDRDVRIIKMTAQITLKGDYRGIRKFLYKVETAEEFVIVEKVQVNQPGGSATGTNLEVGLTVATYYLADRTRMGNQ